MIRSLLFPAWPLEPFDFHWSSYQIGFWGERAVARHLWKQGARVVAHRWVASSGSDIDLVVEDAVRIRFCEVKVRTHALDQTDPWSEVMDRERTQRLVQAAGEYLLSMNQPFVSIRFDAFLVIPQRTQLRKPKILVMENYLNPTTVPGWRGSPQL